MKELTYKIEDGGIIAVLLNDSLVTHCAYEEDPEQAFQFCKELFDLGFNVGAESQQKHIRDAKDKLSKALDAMDDLHSTCCSLIINATDCVSHFEVSGNSMNTLEDVTKSKEVQRVLNIRLLELRPTPN